VEGLFRVSGEAKEIEEYKALMDPYRLPNDCLFAPHTDAHVVTGLLKAFFRELPAPFIKYAESENCHWVYFVFISLLCVSWLLFHFLSSSFFCLHCTHRSGRICT
jgi:hypothetical protein